MDELTGRHAVVTGAGSGIGAAIAQSLARAGCHVVVADIDLAAATVVAEQVSALSVRGIAVRVDVADPASVDELAARAYTELGRVDILVNNAGVGLRPFRSTWDTSVRDFAWVMQVNYGGVVNSLAAFLPRLRAQGSPAHIVNTSSMSSFADVGGLAAYSASKAAIDALSGSLRAELRTAKDPIEVSVLFPGGVNTRLATSERLRPESERSDSRGVVPWSDYLDTPVSGVPSAVADAPAFVDPSEVGDLVVAGMRAGAPFIATSPPSRAALIARAEALANAFVGGPSSS